MYPFKINFLLLGIPVEIGPYALFFFLAIVTAVTGCIWFAVKRGFNGKRISLMLLIMLLSAVVGARLLNGLVNFSAYYSHPLRLFELGATGFSLYGGIVMAVLSGLFYCKIFRLDEYKLGDTFIPFLGIGIAIMRVGCFLQGCCYGVETDLPWGVKFPMLSPAHLHQIGLYGNFMEVYAVHPTQIYELLVALTLSAAAFLMLHSKGEKPARGLRADGITMFGFIAFFSLFRLFNSFLRVNPDGFSAPWYFYPLFYLGIITVCGIFLKKKFSDPGRIN